MFIPSTNKTKVVCPLQPQNYNKSHRNLKFKKYWEGILYCVCSKQVFNILNMKICFTFTAKLLYSVIYDNLDSM